MEIVGPNETTKVWAREGVDLAPCTVKVGGDWSLEVTLVGVKVDEAHR